MLIFLPSDLIPDFVYYPLAGFIVGFFIGKISKKLRGGKNGK